VLDKALTEMPLWRKEIAQQESTLYNNIAALHSKLDNPKKEAYYTSLVIERALFLSDTQVLWKSYLRRGLANEKLGREKDAISDLLRVKELQPNYKQADQALQRCLNQVRLTDSSYELPVYADSELAAEKINPD
jgi:tetratricopeptide (TPR) repeat protein